MNTSCEGRGGNHFKMVSMHRNQKGMSLVEIMVAIAVSTIVISAAYGSYTIISKNYEFQKDVKYMSQTARPVAQDE